MVQRLTLRGPLFGGTQIVLPDEAPEVLTVEFSGVSSGGGIARKFSFSAQKFVSVKQVGDEEVYFAPSPPNGEFESW